MRRTGQLAVGILQLLGAMALSVFSVWFLMQSTYEFARDGEHRLLDFWVPFWTGLFAVLSLVLAISGAAALLRSSQALQKKIGLLALAISAALLTLGVPTLLLSIPAVFAVFLQASLALNIEPKSA